jgi:HAD superfamily hydrolase (TIGR01509 family)
LLDLHAGMGDVPLRRCSFSLMRRVAMPPATPRLPRRPKAVVFDMDGTLIDSERLVLAGYMDATRRFGLDFSHEQFLSLVGRSREHSAQLMRGYFGADFPLDEFYAAVSAHVGDGVAPLKPGALELMDDLDRRATPYGLATSSGRPWVDRHFSAHSLHSRFRAIVTRMDVVNGKPHPEPYLKAAHALGVDPADILAIEDSPVGARSAHAAGMMILLVPDLIQPDAATGRLAHHVGATLHDAARLLAD